MTTELGLYLGESEDITHYEMLRISCLRRDVENLDGTQKSSLQMITPRGKDDAKERKKVERKKLNLFLGSPVQRVIDGKRTERKSQERSPERMQSKKASVAQDAHGADHVVETIYTRVFKERKSMEQMESRLRRVIYKMQIRPTIQCRFTGKWACSS
ncbi:hypothetical protein SCHPADRAFT_897095 [Schizopora paradoxa]|uniref:Uncharacterized protein n=1 Tax=Schizopora paradoxa TaxID=27342 RepID=A0A0H2QY81_9AGAM|nr:hypothetical protein SCHPADRAFT_897095 [Schizopora paradoxa]